MRSCSCRNDAKLGSCRISSGSVAHTSTAPWVTSLTEIIEQIELLRRRNLCFPIWLLLWLTQRRKVSVDFFVCFFNSGTWKSRKLQCLNFAIIFLFFTFYETIQKLCFSSCKKSVTFIRPKRNWYWWLWFHGKTYLYQPRWFLSFSCIFKPLFIVDSIELNNRIKNKFLSLSSFMSMRVVFCLFWLAVIVVIIANFFICFETSRF